MQDTKKNIIFLDIDSVLNYSRFGQDSYDTGNDRTEDFVEQKTPICKSCLEALNHIVVNAENPAVVWSTSWALEEREVWNGWNNPRLYVERLPWMKDLVVGRTPRKMSSERCEEIHFWLHNNEYVRKYHDKKWCEGERFYDIHSFAVIDDIERGMERYGDHFFRTEYDTGLTMEQAKGIVEFLKMEDYRSEDWFKDCDK